MTIAHDDGQSESVQDALAKIKTLNGLIPICASCKKVRDDKGYYWFQGRGDDVLKVAGRWVTPNEIEDALCKHEAVAEAGAAAFEQGGLTKPMAFVIPRGDVEADEALAKALSAHVAETLAPYKAPRFVEFVTTLPRGDRDKLDRKALSAQAAETARARGLE